MFVAAYAMGILSDGAGLECLTCGGKCTIAQEEGEETNCPECEAQGRWYPEITKELEKFDEYELMNYAETVMFIRGLSERPLTPNEWFALPAKYVCAYRFLAPFVFGEFEERFKEKNKNDATESS